MTDGFDGLYFYPDDAPPQGDAAVDRPTPVSDAALPMQWYLDQLGDA